MTISGVDEIPTITRGTLLNGLTEKDYINHAVENRLITWPSSLVMGKIISNKNQRKKHMKINTLKLPILSGRNLLSYRATHTVITFTQGRIDISKV